MQENTVMKLTRKQHLIAAALAGALALTSAYAQTPDSVGTRIGTLRFEKGYPTPETARKLYDEMDFQRAVRYGDNIDGAQARPQQGRSKYQHNSSRPRPARLGMAALPESLAPRGEIPALCP
jgi:hypothetical protein